MPPLRADAQRNRDKLLEAAVARFSADGPGASLDAIARDAGVGNATLYRHFATREALIEAAYRSELTSVCDAAPELLDAYPPEQALRLWMERFLGYMTAKMGMADVVRAAIDAGTSPPTGSRERLDAALKLLLDAAAEAGAVRPGLDPDDVAMSLAGIGWVATGPAAGEQAGRLVELLLDALAPR